MKTIEISFDKLKKDNWSEQEQQNVKTLIDFIQNLMNNHDFEKVKKMHGNEFYRQHNRAIPDGFDNLIKYVGAFAKRFPAYAYDVKHIYADGNFVTFHSHVTTKASHRGNDKKGLNIIDTWRIENGNIMEHWDAIQPIDGFMRFYLWLTGGTIANANGIF